MTRLSFLECTFTDCLFVGTFFHSVRFHDCTFECCNFFRSRFRDVYAKPHHSGAPLPTSHTPTLPFTSISNYERSYQESQKEFKNEAEYYFAVWSRRNDVLQARRKKEAWYCYVPSFVIRGFLEPYSAMATA